MATHTKKLDQRSRRGRGLGAGGRCICAKCGRQQTHNPGIPCMEERCPECGAVMVREGSKHHRKIEARKASVR